MHKQVLAFALSLTKSKAQAEDLARDAIRRVFDPKETAWNPVTQPDVVFFLMSLVRRNASHERTSGRRHHEITAPSKAHQIRVTRAAESVPSPAQTPDVSLEMHDLAARRLAALRKRAAADPLVLSLVDAFASEIETPAEQVEALSVPLEDIRRARRRLFDHSAAVARDLPADGSVTSDEDAEVGE